MIIFSIIFLLILSIQFIHSEKLIEITRISNTRCANLYYEDNLQLSFELINQNSGFSKDTDFLLPLAGNTNLRALCLVRPSVSIISCNMNPHIHPVINEEVSFNTSITKIDDITIKYNFIDSDYKTIYKGTCAFEHTHIFKETFHDEETKCDENGYNVLNIFGTYEKIEGKNFNSFLLEEENSIKFTVINNNGKYDSSICQLKTTEGKMKCQIYGEGKYTFFRTTISNDNNNDIILLDQSFQLELKDCSPPTPPAPPETISSNYIKFSLLILLSLILFNI